MKSTVFHLFKASEEQSVRVSSEDEKPLESISSILFESTPSRWSQGILAWACTVSVVAALNLVFVVCAEIYNTKEYNGKNRSSIRILYDGDCKATEKVDTGAHILINILSSVLLGASSYAMQCLSAPTREEIDWAHADSTWLDIGILSVRNLRRIHRKRVFIWILLGFSSLPLHLFYNAMVFASRTSNRYAVLLVNDAFTSLSSTSFNLLEGSRMAEATRGHVQTLSIANHYFQVAKSSKLQKLNAGQCVKAYEPDYLENRGTLLMVVSSSSADSPFNSENEPFARFLSSDGVFESTEWLCNTASEAQGQPYKRGSVCGDFVTDLGNKLTFNKTEKWHLFTNTQEVEVQYCLSEQVEEHCHVQYSLEMAILVTLVCILKATILIYMAYRIRESSLKTIGDAISSFLRFPDPYTKGMCLLGQTDFEKHDSTMRANKVPKSFKPGRLHHRWHAIRPSRKWTVGAALSGTLALTVAFLSVGAHQAQVNGESNPRVVFLTLGLGRISTSALLGGPGWHLPFSGNSAIISNVFVANTPQLLISFLYMICNGVVTTMCMASEWSRFGVERKGLRVSGPRNGAQRRTYFIQMPYRHGVPLAVLFVLLHWLLSQSIFVVNVEFLDYLEDGNKATVAGKDNINLTCGYSPVALLCTVAVEVVLIGYMILGGRMKLDSGMPIVGSCSVAIAAACQPSIREEGDTAAISVVKWGAMNSGDEIVGHCGFSMHPVEEPEGGKLYA